jgi:hypothetical protein
VPSLEVGVQALATALPRADGPPLFAVEQTVDGTLVRASVVDPMRVEDVAAALRGETERS